jgi:uncharacterized protein (DUF2147 family)
LGPTRRAASADSILGFWSTQDGNGVIAVERCGPALCGRIVGIVRPPGAPIPADAHGASPCGLTIIHEKSRSADGVSLGSIDDPATARRTASSSGSATMDCCTSVAFSACRCSARSNYGVGSQGI